jgi:hypothetical protein
VPLACFSSTLSQPSLNLKEILSQNARKRVLKARRTLVIEEKTRVVGDGQDITSDGVIENKKSVHYGILLLQICRLVSAIKKSNSYVIP